MPMVSMCQQAVRIACSVATMAFKGRNTQAQIDLDAGDLRAAMERDLRTLRTNLVNDGRLSSGEIDSVLQRIRDVNGQRGIG